MSLGGTETLGLELNGDLLGLGLYSDLMGFYSDFMGFYSDLMGFYSDLMKYLGEYPLVS